MAIYAWVDVVDSSFGTSAIYSIAHSPSEGQWVAVGADGKIATSPNRENWTQQTDHPFGAVVIGIVVRSESLDLWIACDQNCNIATSSNGVNWTSRTTAMTGGFAGGGCDMGNRILLVNEGGEIQSSADGTTWALETEGFSGSIYAVAYSITEDLAAAVGNSGKLETSPDGDTWTDRTSSYGTNAITCIHYSEATDVWVSGGNNGANGLVASSTSATTGWTQRTITLTGESAAAITYEAVLGTWLLTAGNQMRSSPDGTTWSTETHSWGTGTMRTIVSSNGGILVGGDSGQMMKYVPTPPSSDAPEKLLVGRSGVRW